MTASLFIAPETVRGTVELVLAIALGSELRPAPPRDWSASDEPPWSSAVMVSGTFRGAVTITCFPAFAYEIARRMLGIEHVSEGIARDALSELANVIGGNIKSQLASDVGEACHLSVPIIGIGQLSIAGGNVLHSEWCDIDGYTVLVEVTEGPRERAVS